MTKLKFYCVTDKEVNFINNNAFNLAWVGKGQLPLNYIKCDDKDNIFFKEKYYSELTFHYWYWKNSLELEKDDCWIGFCQKRRYWGNEGSPLIVDKETINKYLLKEPNDEWEKYESIICNPIDVSGAKRMKLIKRGWRNLIKKPSILFNKDHQNLKVHFDMHHGYGNLDKAIALLDDKKEREDFNEYVNCNTKFNPHIMFIAKKNTINQWFSSLFPWLESCEKEFGFKNLKGYETTRIYAYLAERYLSFWFRKHTNFKEQPWFFLEN
ncbi:DUF4422 domain-containing protein [Pelagibacterales bacterium SAG-MED07]|nr:DUF4422 domain-containing protein [Pelagibacterales bacterium SAG-MED07]